MFLNVKYRYFLCLQDDGEGAAEGRKNRRGPANISETRGQIDETAQRRSVRILQRVDASDAFAFRQLTHEEQSVQGHAIELEK